MKRPRSSRSGWRNTAAWRWRACETANNRLGGLQEVDTSRCRGPGSQRSISSRRSKTASAKPRLYRRGDQCFHRINASPDGERNGLPALAADLVRLGCGTSSSATGLNRARLRPQTGRRNQSRSVMTSGRSGLLWHRACRQFCAPRGNVTKSTLIRAARFCGKAV